MFCWKNLQSSSALEVPDDVANQSVDAPQSIYHAPGAGNWAFLPKLTLWGRQPRKEMCVPMSRSVWLVLFLVSAQSKQLCGLKPGPRLCSSGAPIAEQKNASSTPGIELSVNASAYADYLRRRTP